MRPQDRMGLELLSIAEVCQELGIGKSWVYRRLKNGEIPSIKLGRSIKVKRSDVDGGYQEHPECGEYAGYVRAEAVAGAFATTHPAPGMPYHSHADILI